MAIDSYDNQCASYFGDEICLWVSFTRGVNSGIWYTVSAKDCGIGPEGDELRATLLKFADPGVKTFIYVSYKILLFFFIF